MKENDQRTSDTGSDILLVWAGLQILTSAWLQCLYKNQAVLKISPLIILRHHAF